MRWINKDFAACSWVAYSIPDPEDDLASWTEEARGSWRLPKTTAIEAELLASKSACKFWTELLAGTSDDLLCILAAPQLTM